jgi:hypothetical protein
MSSPARSAAVKERRVFSGSTPMTPRCPMVRKFTTRLASVDGGGGRAAA